MITLFIDTSTSTLSIGVFNNDKLLSSVKLMSNEHSKNTLYNIELLLKEQKINPKDVNKIMIINGPGSFTGLRIGVTIAKIYAWACNAKVIPISTLKAYALSYENHDNYVSLIDARREFVYAGIYDKNYNSIMEDKYINKEDLLTETNKLNDVIVIGDTDLGKYDIYSNDLNIQKIYDYYKNEEGISSHLLNPVYLKKTEAEEKLGDRMIRDYQEKDFNSVSILGRDINSDYVFSMNEVGKCFVYEFENEVVGFAVVDLFEDRSELIDIAVALAHRNKGIGKKLVEKVINESKNNGCKSITLEVKCNNDFAITLYKNSGFKLKNIRKKYYSNGTVDAYLMYREL